MLTKDESVVTYKQLIGLSVGLTTLFITTLYFLFAAHSATTHPTAAHYERDIKPLRGDIETLRMDIREANAAINKRLDVLISRDCKHGHHISTLDDSLR